MNAGHRALKTANDWIRHYVDRGMRPIPVYPPSYGCRCKAPTKRCMSGTCHGKTPMIEHWADRDPASIVAKRYPDDVNVALAMGQQPNGKWLVAIDIDGMIMDPSAFLGPLPPTLQAYTGGGTHLIYSVPANVPFGNWNALVTMPTGSIDLKYCRGAVVAPPSIHRNGSHYQWIESAHGQLAQSSMRDPVPLPTPVITRLIDLHRIAYPNARRYDRWSDHPDHRGKRA